jgi:predicted RNase H-like nuclease
MAKMLEQNGFRHDPFMKRFEHSKKLFEVFPHSAMVVIFKLKHTLKYKAGKNRDYVFRWQEFEKYQGYLKSLKNRKPSLTMPRYILETDVRELKGKALKRYEDLLDAVFCAYKKRGRCVQTFKWLPLNRQ